MTDGATHLDFCLAQAGSNFAGTPYLSGLGLNGLGYTQVSEYAAAPGSGAYSIRVVSVDGGSADCTSAVLSETTVTADGGASLGTLAVIGTARGASYLPDDSPSDGGASEVWLRVVHAAPGEMATDFRSGPDQPGQFRYNRESPSARHPA